MAGIYLSDLIEGSAITLKISNKVKTIEMHASLLRALREDLAIIELDFQSNQRLNFDNVHIEMESQTEDGTPYKWNNVKIGFLKNSIFCVQREQARALIGVNISVSVFPSGLLCVWLAEVKKRLFYEM